MSLQCNGPHFGSSLHSNLAVGHVQACNSFTESAKLSKDAAGGSEGINIWLKKMKKNKQKDQIVHRKGYKWMLRKPGDWVVLLTIHVMHPA